MKFSENWLRTYVNPALDSAALGHALTMAGLEVEAMEPAAPPFDKVVVAHVISLAKHPDADRLNVCQVDVGQGAPLQIVCGAANVHAGAKVPCALVGAVLPKITIKQAKVRGVASAGMLCSEQELGLAEEATGLLLLPSDAPVGSDIREYLDLNDQLYTIKLTPNRADCLSLTGLAREVAAVTGDALTLPLIEPVSAAHDATLMVKMQMPEACPRYCGRIVRGVNAKATTPEWMVKRLTRSGLRSISVVVDITNYVLLEQGQPLHAFDLAKLTGGITVRMAQAGEQIKLLNDQTVTLEADMLVIADDARAVALAGIMGGMETAVDDHTHDVFLESAFFTPDIIAGRARRLGLSTDSSHRFERGVDFAATRACIERATRLMLEICGGQAGPVTEVSGQLPARNPIRLRAERASKVLGLDLSPSQIESLLTRLHLGVEAHGDTLQVTPPSYRFDLSIEEDLIEEIARLYGYDNIPAIPPRARLDLLPRSEAVRPEEQLRERLVSRDYQEVITYSFVEPGWEAALAGNMNPVVLQNPIASQMSVMRSTLWGGLVDVLRFNLNRKQPRVRIFEIGRVFESTQSGVAQTMRLSALSYGAALPEQWGDKAREVDFFDLKGDLEALLWPEVASFEVAPHPALHPGQSARVFLGGKAIGWIGALHPKWVQQYGLPQTPVLFELAISIVLSCRLPKFSEIAKFPPVRRDIAVIVDENITSHALLVALREVAPEMVTDLAIFDLYSGKGIDSGKKSLAFRVLMQDTEKTLTDQEVETVITRLTQVLSDRFGAKLR
ncbi:MAG: phenylalanine--tRNA ligase subunit beta [Burkholderiales bacterium]|nr:phenylalanine--tRNA ligase subunit beta [Burkholderiales bacterium]